MSERREGWAVLCRRIAWVAAGFSLVLGVMLLVNVRRLHAGSGGGKLHLVEGRELSAMKAALVDDPKNEVLKLELRELDRVLRRDMLRRERLMTRGGTLLVIGFVIMIGSMQLALHFRVTPLRQTFPPSRDPALEESRAGGSVAVGSLMLVGFLLVMFAGSSPSWDDYVMPTVLASGDAQPVAATVTRDPDWYVATADAAMNWPRFRGPGGMGMTDFEDIPTSWDGESGEGVLWKVETGLPGEGSPVVWGEQIFLIGASEDKQEISCYDLSSGKLLWREDASSPESRRAEPPEVMDMTGYAASTPVTDGRRVFAIFANGDLAAFTSDGERLWVKWLGTPVNAYGHAISLLMWRNRLLVQFDVGDDGSKGESRIMAFDAESGDQVWSTQRMVPNSWATPIMIKVDDQDQIITTANPWVIAYNPENGEEIWRVNCLKGDVAPSPVYMNGLVYVVSDGACFAAIRPDGQGDVGESHVEWRIDKSDFPDMCSLICDGPQIYTMVFGKLHAYDSLTGKLLWRHDLEEEFQASPTLVAGKMYLLTRDGMMVIGVAGKDKFELIGTSELDEECGASPVFVAGRIILRGRENLYCIGGSDGE